MKKYVVFICFLWINVSFAQKIEGNINDLGFLEDVTNLNIVYDFSEFGVGKFEYESDYIAKKVSEYNKKEEGRGDEWKKKWHSDKENRYMPQFEELFHKYLEGKIVAKNDHSGAPITLIVKTTFIEPGFNVGVWRENAYIDLELLFVKSDNYDEILASYKMYRAPGRGAGGYDFDTGYRLEEAYAKAGKSFGKYLVKSKVF